MQLINKRLLIAIGALLVVCGASLSSSALARGNDVAATTSSSHSEQETEKSKALKEEFKQKGKAKVQEETRAKVKAKTQEQKQKSCEARKTNLTKRMNNSVAAAERHKAVFDKIYVRIQTFYTNKKLDVANYDALKADVETAQQDAADKITALKALEIDVDCTQTDSLATNLSAFREAVKSTRDSLKDYRKALVSLTTQLHGASTGTSGDSADDSSTNETTN